MNIMRFRCKECGHSLRKSEYDPGSVKFKIQLSAYYHIPYVRVKQVPNLIAGKEVTIELTLTNPTSHEVSVELLPMEEANTPTGSELLFPEVTCTPQLPKGILYLPAKDDTAEYDDPADKMDDRNDKRWRIEVIPEASKRCLTAEFYESFRSFIR